MGIKQHPNNMTGGKFDKPKASTQDTCEPLGKVANEDGPFFIRPSLPVPGKTVWRINR